MSDDPKTSPKNDTIPSPPPDRLGDIERRLSAIEANQGLCLNYLRELARARLSDEQLRAFEIQAFGPPQPPEGTNGKS